VQTQLQIYLTSLRLPTKRESTREEARLAQSVLPASCSELVEQTSREKQQEGRQQVVARDSDLRMEEEQEQRL
jgi:hypothetical protein